jgi:hypothetical protein
MEWSACDAVANMHLKCAYLLYKVFVITLLMKNIGIYGQRPSDCLTPGDPARLRAIIRSLGKLAKITFFRGPGVPVARTLIWCTRQARKKISPSDTYCMVAPRQ